MIELTPDGAFGGQQFEFGEEEIDMHAVAALIERNMRDDDANDPLLESYQDPQ